MKQATVARAIDVLRSGPMTSAAFALRMWPERAAGRTHGQHTKMGHALLRRIAELNYAEKLGDLWMVRRLDGGTAYGSLVNVDTNGHAVGHPLGQVPASGSFMGPFIASPVGQTIGPTNGSTHGQAAESAEQLRLHRLVQQATEPVASVTHDSTFGDIRIRSIAIDGALVEACAIVVLSGKNANIYPPYGSMIVGLSPAEAGRALHVRSLQSGQPPELARPGGWIVAPDGVVAAPGAWRPAGAPAAWVDREDVRARVQRQRAAAGLA